MSPCSPPGNLILAHYDTRQLTDWRAGSTKECEEFFFSQWLSIQQEEEEKDDDDEDEAEECESVLGRRQIQLSLSPCPSQVHPASCSGLV